MWRVADAPRATCATIDASLKALRPAASCSRWPSARLAPGHENPAVFEQRRPATPEETAALIASLEASGLELEDAEMSEIATLTELGAMHTRPRASHRGRSE